MTAFKESILHYNIPGIRWLWCTWCDDQLGSVNDLFFHGQRLSKLFSRMGSRSFINDMPGAATIGFEGKAGEVAMGLDVWVFACNEYGGYLPQKGRTARKNWMKTYHITFHFNFIQLKETKINPYSIYYPFIIYNRSFGLLWRTPLPNWFEPRFEYMNMHRKRKRKDWMKVSTVSIPNSRIWHVNWSGVRCVKKKADLKDKW